MRDFARLLVALTLLVMVGCETTPEKAAPAPIGSPPQDLQLQRVLISTDIPLDEDANGYPDTLRIFAYLFGDQNQYPLPVHAPGNFEFMLRNPQGEAIAHWDLDDATTSAARRKNVVGAVYVFVLDLRTASSDRLPLDTYLLDGTFEGLGQRVSANPLRVQLGRD